MIKRIAFLLLSIILPLQSIEITLWHAFEGPIEGIFVSLVDDFNQTSGIHVSAIPKGNYTEVFERGLSSFQHHQNPHIIQIYEVATLSAMLMPNVFKPAHEFMTVPEHMYIDTVKHFYTSPEGKMLSLPWNISTGVMFFNKELFANEGLEPPQTWEELEIAGARFAAKGIIGFTTAWPAAYHLEHFLCWHNIPFGTLSNGFGGHSEQFIFNLKGSLSPQGASR